MIEAHAFHHWPFNIVKPLQLRILIMWHEWVHSAEPIWLPMEKAWLGQEPRHTCELFSTVASPATSLQQPYHKQILNHAQRAVPARDGLPCHGDTPAPQKHLLAPKLVIVLPERRLHQSLGLCLYRHFLHSVCSANPTRAAG